MESEYAGPAVLAAEGSPDLPVEVALSGATQPIDGRFRWGGRIAPSDEVAALFEGGARAVRLTVPGGGTTDAQLRERDPWGGCRITGSGRPPFPLPPDPDLS